MTHYAYEVFRPGAKKPYDTVFATYDNPKGFPTAASREEDQKRSLINHDGYPHDIIVRERKSK